MGHGLGWNRIAQSQIIEDYAKAAAQQYADKYLKGYKVDRVLPYTGMGGAMTMFQAEISGPDGESRLLRINPWGNVMPFGGPRRAGDKLPRSIRRCFIFGGSIC